MKARKPAAVAAMWFALATASAVYAQPDHDHGGDHGGERSGGGHHGDDHGGPDLRAGPGGRGPRGGDVHGGPGLRGRGPTYHGYGGYGYGGLPGYAGPFAVGSILGYYEGRPYYCYRRHHWRWSPYAGRYVLARDRFC